jgi:hypothetical protein
LTVISDDHEILDAARRRGCKTLRSEEFLHELRKRRRRAPSPSEPMEKPSGLTETQLEHWLTTFANLTDEPSATKSSPFTSEEKNEREPR